VTFLTDGLLFGLGLVQVWMGYLQPLESTDEPLEPIHIRRLLT
jgi:hypothetical protein